jgi:hypothetical protein
MSCPLDTILDQDAQKTIDTGVKYITDKIKTVRKFVDVPTKDKKKDMFKDCTASKVNKGILWTNIALQIVVLLFLGFIAVTRGEKDWSIDALTYISWVTSGLVLIQYRDILMSSAKLFMYGVGRKTQIITVVSVLIVLLTKLLYDKEGLTVSIVAMMVFALIAVRVWFQIKSTFDANSTVSMFLDFINRLMTVDRINVIKGAFV